MPNRAAAAMARIRVATDRALAPERRAALLAEAARRALAEALSTHRAAPPYTRTVDGVLGAPESAVRAEGSVLYRFNLLPAAIGFALGYAQQRSPIASGDYRRAWRIYVDGRLLEDEPDAIPAGATCMLVNPMPYTRKVEVGGMRMSVPPGVVEAMRQALRRRYPMLRAELSYVSLSGTDPRGGDLPYILKGHGRDSGLSYDRKTNVWKHRHAGKPSGRKDRAAGQRLTYPALIISMKDR